jgi:hypothetical protein
MSLFAVVDVVLGLIFVFVLLSLAVTAANEAIASAWGRRRTYLHRGITNLLRDDGLTRKIYDHPLIRALYRDKREPSYIPSRLFALALLDEAAPVENGRRPGITEAFAQRHARLADALRTLLEDAGGDADGLKRNIEIWFNQSMERVAGWYKRRTQLWVFALGLVVTVTTNADTLRIVQALWRDPALRQAVAARAERYAAAAQQAESQPAPGPAASIPPFPPYDQPVDPMDRFNAAMTELHQLELPIGWRTRQEMAELAEEDASIAARRDQEVWPGTLFVDGFGAVFASWRRAVAAHWFGWLLTILAISLGAPFWFDMLNKVIAIRGVGKSPEERPKEPKQIQQALQPGRPA